MQINFTGHNNVDPPSGHHLYLGHSLDTRRPLGADGKPITGVFNIAPRNDFATFGLEGCANPEE